MSYRPTTLKLLDESCPRALDHYEAGVPIDREIFQGGIAAHAILQATGEETNRRGEILSYEDMQAVAAAVCSKLLTDGRSFDGTPEPPMSPYQAADGRDVALAWLAVNPLEPGAHYEIGVGVDHNWEATSYDHREETVHAKLRTIIDYLRQDEDDGERVLTVRDYKSAWPTDASRLRFMQQKIQVLLALAHFPDVDRVTVEIVNLKSRVTYREDHWLADPDTDERLAEWRSDVETAIAAAEVKPREARPGVRCTGCWYLGACEDAQEWLDTVSPQASKEDMATAYAVTVAEVGRLRDLLKSACGETPVEIDGGLVGYQRQPYRELKPDAYGTLLEEWCSQAEDESPERLRGLLRAMKLTKANAEHALKVLYPERADIEHRKEFIASHTEEKAKRRFLVSRKPKEAE